MTYENRNERRLPCRARFLGASTSALRGDVTDISESGVCLHSPSPVKRGQSLHLDFELATGVVEAVGEVRWVKRTKEGYEVGIRFVRITSQSLEAIVAATSA